MAVKHGPCLLTLNKKDPGCWNQVSEETFPHLLLGAQDQRLGAEQGPLPYGSTGTSSGKCHEKETCMVRACLTPRQPVQNHPSWHLWGWAEEMLDGQHRRVDIPAHARSAHKGLLQKRLEEDLCWIIPHVCPTTKSIKVLTWTDQSLKERFRCMWHRSLSWKHT